ncbi:DUF4375 domain-containing protein [Kribbella sp. NPDC050459]|uniref:DMP19 family protein n=1 Tax=Kribbella sp. NPDC050459 TaxID=3155785 RepID=UPI0033D2B1F0
MATDVWDLYAQLGEGNRSAPTAAQRQVLAVCDLRQEVNAGGFDAYFRYWGGDSAAEALAALPELLGQDWANLLREAMELLGDPYPDDPDDRADRIDTGGLDETLNALDVRFYALEGSSDADSRLSAYIDANLS